MDEKIATKVKKLLALAGSPNEHEARLAAERAAELMTRHNLSMQQVKSAAEKEGMAQQFIKMKWRTTEDKFIYGIVNKFFFVELVYARNRHRDPKLDHWQVNFLGTPSNIEIAQYVYGFLTRTYRELWKQYKAQTHAPEGHRQSYYLGLTHGLREQLQKRQQAVSDEMGLVVVKNPDLQRYLHKLYPDLGSMLASIPDRDASARMDGMSDGRAIRINPGVGGSAGTKHIGR